VSRFRVTSLLCLSLAICLLFIAWKAAPYVVMGIFAEEYYDAHWTWMAILLFVDEHERMPNSIGELMRSGCLIPATVGEECCYLVAGGHQVKDLASVKIAWGVGPEDLTVKNGQLYYKDRANRRAFLIAYRCRLLHLFDRKGEETYNIILYNRMCNRSSSRTLPDG